MKKNYLILLGVGVVAYILWKKRSSSPLDDISLMSVAECEDRAESVTFSSDEEKTAWVEACTKTYSGFSNIGGNSNSGGKCRNKTHVICNRMDINGVCGYGCSDPSICSTCIPNEGGVPSGAGEGNIVSPTWGKPTRKRATRR